MKKNSCCDEVTGHQIANDDLRQVFLAETIERLEKMFPLGFVPRKKVSDITGFSLNARTLANRDSQKRGVPGAFKINGQVVYPILNFAEYLADHVEMG